MRIAVAGGTGVVGRYVVDAVRARGDEPVVLARSTGVDVMTGQGLDAALDGAGAVIDVTNLQTLRRRTAEEFFETATGNLLAAAGRSGAGHYVALSIVGSDRVDFGYYLGKRRQEELCRASATPTTVLRTSQWHEFAGQTLDRMPGPVAVVPRMRTRPVAAVEVGARLAELAAGAPHTEPIELVGPEEHDLANLCRRVVRARGQRRVVLGMRMPGAAGRDMAAGGLLPRGEHEVGKQAFGVWLARAAAGR